MVFDKTKVYDSLKEKLEYENRPFRHVSALDLVNIGYEFTIGRDEKLELFLMDVKHCSKALEIDTFLKQLFHLGIDTLSGIYIEAVVHRPVQTNKPTYGYRFGGLERMDSEWVNGEFVSYEARMASSNMSDMWNTVKGMSGTPSDKVAERFYQREKNKKKKGE